MSNSILGCVFLAAISTGVGVVSAQTAYYLTPLTIGGSVQSSSDNAFAADLNDAGQVAGTRFDEATRAFLPFRWTPIAPNRISGHFANFAGGGQAHAIDSSGNVLIQTQRQTGPQQFTRFSVVWDGEAVTSTLGDHFLAYDLADNGQAVGTLFSPSGYDAHAQAIGGTAPAPFQPTSGTTQRLAVAMRANAAGRVLMRADSITGTPSIIFTGDSPSSTTGRADRPFDFTASFGTPRSAFWNDLNDAGTVVGTVVSDNIAYAAKYTDDPTGNWTASPVGSATPLADSRAWAINNDGEIAGTVGSDVVVWGIDGSVQNVSANLETSSAAGWSLERPIRMNDAGQIIVRGRVDADGSPATPDLRGYALLSPGKAGDADFSGSVDFDDLLTLAQHYALAEQSWTSGDFSGDGVVGFDDLLLLAQNYSSSSFVSDFVQVNALVPEPATLLVMLAGVPVLHRRRVCAA